MSNVLYCPGSIDVRHAGPLNFPTINEIGQFRQSINFVSQCAYQFYLSPIFFCLPNTRFSKAVIHSFCRHSNHKPSPTQPHAFRFFHSTKTGRINDQFLVSSLCPDHFSVIILGPNMLSSKENKVL